MTDEMFDKGMALRRKMLGPEGAEKKLEEASDFIMPLEQWVTQQCFGEAWHRPVLNLKTRSMLTLAMLTAAGQAPQVRYHVLGALENGVSPDEIREIFMHAIIYCGLPRAVNAFLVADELLKNRSEA